VDKLRSVVRGDTDSAASSEASIRLVDDSDCWYEVSISSVAVLGLVLEQNAQLSGANAIELIELQVEQFQRSLEAIS